MVSDKFVTIYNFPSVEFDDHDDYHDQCSDAQHNWHQYNDPIGSGHAV